MGFTAQNLHHIKQISDHSSYTNPQRGHIESITMWQGSHSFFKLPDFSHTGHANLICSNKRAQRCAMINQKTL